MEIILLVASVLLGILGMSEGCTPPEGGYVPPTLEEKMMNSPIVVHGVPLSTEPDRRLGENAYSVNFEVQCIYKGGPVDEVIRIEAAGSVLGHCTTKDLEVGQKSLVYLSQTGDGHYEQYYSGDPGSDEYLEEIVILCDTKISYPKGVTERSGKEQCPSTLDTSECQPNSATNPPRPEPEVEVLPGNPGSSDDVPVIAPSREDNGRNSCAALAWQLVTLLLGLSIFLL